MLIIWKNPQWKTEFPGACVSPSLATIGRRAQTFSVGFSPPWYFYSSWCCSVSYNSYDIVKEWIKYWEKLRLSNLNKSRYFISEGSEFLMRNGASGLGRILFKFGAMISTPTGCTGPAAVTCVPTVTPSTRHLPGGSVVKKSPCQCRRLGFGPWVRKIPWRRKSQRTVVFFPGESQGQRRLVDYGPWGCKEWDLTEHAPDTWPEYSHCRALWGISLGQSGWQITASFFHHMVPNGTLSDSEFMSVSTDSLTKGKCLFSF